MTRHPNRFKRRGIAMMLVLISLATATILTTAYLASRDNSAAIGTNVADAAAARWACESGLEYGVALLQTDSAWRTSHSDGLIIDDFSFNGALIDVELVDLETNLPPDENTENLLIISTAISNGIRQVATAHAFVATDERTTVTVDLSEFAVFASSKMILDDTSTITRWPNAPLSRLGERIAVGTRGTVASTIEINGQGTAIDTTLYHGPGASDSLVMVANDTVLQNNELPDLIPIPASPDPGVAVPVVDDVYPFIDEDGTRTRIGADARHSEVRYRRNADVTFAGDFTFIANHDFRLESGAQLTIDGNVTMILWGDLVVHNNASIELTDGSTLTVFVADDLLVDDGYIGNIRADATRDNSGAASFMDPNRIQFYDNNSYVPNEDLADEASKNWLLKDNSVVKANIYAPSTRVVIQDASALYGRVTTSQLRLRHDGALFYDPALDGGTGYTNPDSLIFDDTGGIKDSVQLLASLSDDDLAALAVEEQLNVKSGEKKIKASGDLVQLIATPVDEPTPRVIPVDVVIQSVGADVPAWEESVEVNEGPLNLRILTLATNVSGYDLSLFNADTEDARTAQRQQIADRLILAADELAENDPAEAVTELMEVLAWVDGTGNDDLMDASATKTQLKTYVTGMLTTTRSLVTP